MTPQPTQIPVRVFISYAWEDGEDGEYRYWVARLAAQLRNDGVDARLDRWHLQSGQTIPDFMDSEIRQADKVLVLCSPKYQEKVHAMQAGGPSTGSGWESMLLSSAMFAQGARSKVVVALAKENWLTSAPSYLQGFVYDDLTHTDETKLRRAYTSLRLRLTGKTEVAPPVNPHEISAPDSTPPLFGKHSSDTLATDKSKLPPNVALPARHRMPYRSLGERFAGRIEPLWNLHDLLHQDGTTIIEGVGVVIGAGGLGKTQLATEYVHRFGNYYPGGVFWTDADQGLATVVQQIAVGAHIAIDGSLSVKQQCEVLWQSLAHSPAPVLIVFDNFPETQPLEPWLPVGTHLKTLVTTRRRDLAYSKIPLPFLSQQEGLELLNNGARKFGAEAIPLIDALGGLPLALELACNFLNRRPELCIAALLTEIAKMGELHALDVFAEHYKNELPTGHAKAIGATFQLSWDLASEAEQKLLKLMSLWAPAPVPRRLLKRAWGSASDSLLTDPVENGISALERLSLVELDQDNDPQIHRLLRGFVRTQTHEGDEETAAQAIEAVKTELSRTRTETDTAALTKLEKVLPHAQIVLDSKIAKSEDASAIANYMSWHQQNIALALQDLGDLDGAKTLLTAALESDQKNFEPGHPSIAISQSNLALVLQDLGDLDGAKHLLTAALKSDQQNFEPGHPSIAISQSNLATVLQYLGDLDGAKTLLTEALQSNQKNLDPGHPLIAISQSNLATALQYLGDLDGAKTLLTEALQSNQKNFDPGHPSIARSQSNLALVLQDLGDLDGAKHLLTEALKSDQQNFEPGHPIIARRQSNLATVLKDLGDLDGAKNLLVQSYKTFKNRLGEGHPNTLRVKRNLEIVESEIK